MAEVSLTRQEVAHIIAGADPAVVMSNRIDQMSVDQAMKESLKMTAQKLIPEALMAVNQNRSERADQLIDQIASLMNPSRSRGGESNRKMPEETNKQNQ